MCTLLYIHFTLHSQDKMIYSFYSSSFSKELSWHEGGITRKYLLTPQPSEVNNDVLLARARFFHVIFITINLKGFLFPNKRVKDEVWTKAAASTSTEMEQ